MDKQEIVAKAEMLIRSPVAKVFEAFVEPAITSKFWFSRGSGKLEAGKTVRWDWEMYGFSVDARVKALEPNKRILVEWSAYMHTDGHRVGVHRAPRWHDICEHHQFRVRWQPTRDCEQRGRVNRRLFVCSCRRESAA